MIDMSACRLSKQINSLEMFSGTVHNVSSIFPIRDFFDKSLSLDLSNVSISTTAQQEDLKTNIYSLIHSPEFSNLYFNLVSEVAAFLPFPVLCQKSPTLRIQRPNENSIIFHIDEWAGHDSESLNVWLPLVDIDSTSALGVVNPNDSASLLSDFYANSISSDLLESFSRSKASFSPMKMGEALFFGNHTLHGTQTNLSDRTRISIDFRLTPESTSRNLHQRYVSPDRLIQFSSKYSAVHRKAIYCIRSTNSLLDVSFQEQRNLISSYCDRHSISIISETHEIQGRPVVELPFITRALEKFPNCDLIMLSKGCFYPEELDRLNDLESKLISTGNQLIFIIS